MLNGFINIYKPKGITSNKILGILKFKLKQNNICTKVGHFGTLDPIAEGVLPVALGRMTRLFDYSLDKVKEYEAEFLFGIDTDTLDTDGKITAECDASSVDENAIIERLPSLVGELDQIPPLYSAKSVNGVKAYDLARKGVEFELKPKKVTVYSIQLLHKTGENRFLFKIRCSGGTYIRSIARDLGRAIGVPCVMSALKRTQSGAFTCENAVNVDDFLPSDVLPPDFLLANFDTFEVPVEYERTLLNGVRLDLNNMPVSKYFAVKCNGNTVGIGEVDEGNKLFIRTWLL